MIQTRGGGQSSISDIPDENTQGKHFHESSTPEIIPRMYQTNIKVMNRSTVSVSL